MYWDQNIRTIDGVGIWEIREEEYNYAIQILSARAFELYTSTYKERMTPNEVPEYLEDVEDVK